MFAQLANLGLTIGGTLWGMNKAEDSAEAAANAAYAAGKAQKKALNKAGDERREGNMRAVGFLRPWEAQGWAGQNLLNDALGVNGPDAQRAFFMNFQNDPGFDAVQRAGIGTVEQSRAVGGGLRSGATMKALQDYGMRLQQSVFQDRMNRLSDVGKVGATAATNMASLTDSASKDLAGYEALKGNATAGGIINASNANQMGTQNMLQLLGYGMGQMKQPINDLLGQFGGGSTNNPMKIGSLY